jgi:indoleacetate--lysine synthetase
MKQVHVNALLGTPSSIIHILKLSLAQKIQLDISKIIFTGESFNSTKRKYIRNYWPDCKFFGLYGHTETGFIGFNTESCLNNHYHYFNNWFFIEARTNHELIVTSYIDKLMPIVRYKVGDAGDLVEQQCQCGIELPILNLSGRIDKKFNYTGNLIDSSLIKNIIESIFQNVDFQIQIDTDQNGNDNLTIILDQNDEEVSLIASELTKLLESIDIIAEVIQNGSGRLNILPRSNFIYSTRQKCPLIVDLRMMENV